MQTPPITAPLVHPTDLHFALVPLFFVAIEDLLWLFFVAIEELLLQLFTCGGCFTCGFAFFSTTMHLLTILLRVLGAMVDKPPIITIIE
jgi:hypothetical protein